MASDPNRKVTALIPEELLRRATRATRAGITPSVLMGLKLQAAQDVYERLRRMRGKVKLSLSWQEMRGEE